MTRRATIDKVVFVVFWLCNIPRSTTASVAAEVPPKVEQKQPELDDATTTNACLADLQNKDGSCKAPNASASPPPPQLECGLFLAESSIPNSGWGMYTGKDIKDEMVIPPVDVVIPVIDSEVHMTLLKHYKRLQQTMGSAVTGESQGFSTEPYFRNSTAIPKLPKWLMDQYYWDCSMTHNYYDAEHIDSVVPGLGMLANSHPGMVLCENVGPNRPEFIGGQASSSSSPYQDQSFVALSDIPAGHELFVEYGDSWFEDRFHKSFGLSTEYSRGNQFAQRWQLHILDKYYEKYGHLRDTMWKDLNDMMMEIMEPINPRIHEVLSRLDLLDTTQRFVASQNPTAYASVPNAPRSMEWLYQNGLCLDHITVADSIVAPGERGAFASRNLPKGTVVAPAPVVHMSRDHLMMLLLDHYDSDIVLWKGHQLLLNYVYGHAESSLLFFPYAPSVNLINHYGGSQKNKKERHPNVKLQWSSKMAHPEWLESWTPDEIVQQEYKAGMVMEIVALEDIAAGDEILLDYGTKWQEAFEQHQATVPSPPELMSIDWDAQKLWTINDKQRYPSFVQTVCWIHEEQTPVYFHERVMEGQGEIPETWLKWKERGTGYMSDTLLCKIVGTQTDGAYYNVVLKETFENRDGTEMEVEVRIQNVPRKAVTVVPNLYTSAELRRDGFRHEIQLSEDMVPEHWRDLKVGVDDENAQCNLYMAESSIPNAGWGVYRGHARPLDPNSTSELDHFCEDLVIQVEDFAVNQMLRNRYLNQPDDPEFDDWLLTRQYALPGDMTRGNFDAEHVQSYTPGCGMLANTHSLLYNSHRMPPVRVPVNKTDASLGANTPYHNAQLVEQFMKLGKRKVRTLETGSEVLVKTSDGWFRNRVDLIGHVPLRSDYYAIDKVVRRFEKLKRDLSDEAARLVWMLLWNTVEAFDLKRIAAALPKDMNEVASLLDHGGSAKYQMPGRVRTQEWLEENGSCVDNIRPGKSTVEMADNGAIATRRIAKDSIIAPVPMIHVHRQHLDIYNSADIFDPKERVFHESKQLITNYCYGHKDSNLLLFPYSPVVNYINHAPSDGGSGDQKIVANAKLRWSSQFNNKEWLDKSPEELIRHHKQPGLAMEVVATREIAQGEEVFIDYGAEWTEAWQNHTQNWKLDKRWRYEAPNNQWLDWMPTEDEIGRRNLFFQFDLPGKFLGCHVRRPDQKLIPVDEEKGEKFLEFPWEQTDGMFRTHTHVYPCEVIERSVDAVDTPYAMIRKDSVSPIQDLYSAVVTVHPGDDSRPPLRFISYDMPRRAIEIFDDEYAAPQFYRGAFRHEIGIPDEMVPAAWRDRKP